MKNCEDKTRLLLLNLKKRALNLMKKGRYEEALTCVRAYGNLAYQFNQFYTDADIERLVCDYERTLPAVGFSREETDENRVLFYDGFGLDTRGLVLIYLQALTGLGYEVIYVTVWNTGKNQVEVPRILSGGKNKTYYLKNIHSRTKYISSLIHIFEKYRPGSAFFYTTPDDIEGEAAFCHYEETVKRFQINLTDHAFWLGTHAFDYCLEFRDYGAYITSRYRGVSKEKIRMLPYYPWIDYNIAFAEFPFDRENKIVIFSGGALYKTIDKDMTYYHMADKILAQNPNVIFLYAGDGDRNGIEWLMERYPNRVYRIDERKDLFQIMKHSDIYLSTYPMTGGLMAQYAAMAGIPPLTLINKGTFDARGCLIDEEKLGILFDSPRLLIKEIERLISDKYYYSMKCKQIYSGVISKEDFTDSMRNLLLKNHTSFSIDFKEVDTRLFRKTYIDRLNDSKIEDAIVTARTFRLVRFYPDLFIKKGVRRLKQRLAGFWVTKKTTD